MASRFDEAAAQWDNNPGRVELARAVGEAIGRAIPFQPGWSALDYGAGTGLLTLNLQPRVASMVALDSSTGMLEKLTQKLAAAASFCVNFSNMPVEESRATIEATRGWRLRVSRPVPAP